MKRLRKTGIHKGIFNHILILFCFLTALSGCGGTFTLHIGHINDHHSHLESDESTSLEFSGKETYVEMGGFPRVTAMLKEIRSRYPDAIRIHAGDAITGTLYYTLFKGEADAALMNTVCFDVFELGNHEFDDGDEGLRNFLDYLRASDCHTPIIAANIEPKIGTPLAPKGKNDYIKPYVIKEIGKEKVGIIGIDIVGKTVNSSNPLPTTKFYDETQTAQKYIDELTNMDINKIVLVTHYQYKNDKSLAKNLKGADVIVGGDSHSLLGDFGKYGLNPAGPYPTVEKDKDGNNVCIVQAWQYSNVVGELHVGFDHQGNVKSCEGTPYLLLGDTFKRKDASGNKTPISGNDLSEVLNIINSDPELQIVTPDPLTQGELGRFSQEVKTLKKTVIGKAAEDLCLERIPGQGKSSICNVSETRAHGSDITNIVALAFKEMSKTSDIAIQNAGGVRKDILSGPITIGDAYTLLPFKNTLIELKMTGQELKNVLEDAFDYAISPGGSSGAYPYASGLRWDLDRSKPKGQRFFNVEVKLKNEKMWHPIDLQETYKVVANQYIASGKDGYITFGNIPKERKVDTYLDYTQSFVDYLKSVEILCRLPYSEYSTQHYYDENRRLR